MSEISKSRLKALGTLLDIFSELTGLPIGLYEYRGTSIEPVYSKTYLERYEPHCQLIQSFPGGRRACEADQCNRASIALKAGDEKLTLCHAGLYNQAVPIETGNQLKSVILFGEMQIKGDKYQNASLEKHRQAASQLGLTNDETEQLRSLLLASKDYRPEQLEKYKQMLHDITRFVNTLVEEEEAIKRTTEKVTHELQTRLQPVIAVSENLMTKAEYLSQEEIKARANDVLNSALALSTVVQSLGDFTQEYRFVKQSIAPILYEARRLYRAEAERRGIQIHIQLSADAPNLEVSKDHLQLAFNNLVHNAVKYSFRNQGSTKRFVKVTGMPFGKCICVTIENYGVGILPEEIDSGMIFELNYQGKLTEREFRTGSGKGLFFTKQVINEHHGSIKVTSRLLRDEPDPEGKPHITQFKIFLPIEQPNGASANGKDDCVD